MRNARPQRNGLLALLPSLLLLIAVPSVADAQAPLLSGLGGPSDFGTECLSPNDDGSSTAIDITPWFPEGLRFFDDTYTQIFVNTNGNISFGDSLSQYTPDPFPVANQPMIAPYWADVDIRGEACTGTGGDRGCMNPSRNGVWWHGEPGRLVVTWDKVGYYRCHDDKVMIFQLILTAGEGGCGGEGDFDVEFRYNECGWETGDASDGENGFGGTEAQAGFDAGNTRDFVEIPGSRAPGIAETLCTDSNVGERGVWRYEIRRGTVTCPDAGEPCLTGDVGVCGDGLTACVGSGVECVAVTEASPERCDAVDNDCDGIIDEGDDLCQYSIEICDMGRCLDVCFEFGCPDGQMCNEAGRCIDIGCEDLVCPAGQRCSAGECVGACDGIVCPHGQACNAGRCSDICGTITCDEGCQVCEEGACIGSCAHAGCPDGQVCQPDGHCIESACVGRTCSAGEFCRDGACVDACDGAVCPPGEMCEMGACAAIMSVQPNGPDAGITGDASTDSDGGRTTGGRGRDDSGCACRVGNTGEMPAALWLLLGLVAWRRRPRF